MNLDKYHNRKVVVVNDNDEEKGIASLIDAHRGMGMKHRAFSLILYRRREDKIEVLLQKRSGMKPVFALKWANACCYNMAPGEEYVNRARSRVREELGIDLEETKLEKLFKFSYFAEDREKKGWCENELDQVIVGEWDGVVRPSLDEVEDYRWVEWEQLKKEIKNEESKFGPWWVEIVREGKLEQYFVGE